MQHGEEKWVPPSRGCSSQAAGETKLNEKKLLGSKYGQACVSFVLGAWGVLRREGLNSKNEGPAYDVIDGKRKRI